MYRDKIVAMNESQGIEVLDEFSSEQSSGKIKHS